MSEAFQKLKAVGFRGQAKRIEDVDLPRIGYMIGVGEDEIHAVIDVEASGSGFDSEGRPKILFEPHVFYRNLSGAKRALAVAKGLAYKDWRPGSYPKDSYPRLMQAMEIDETAALKACSWGLGQILGENHVAAGYETPQEMVVDFCVDEDNHLEAMVRFIIANKLDDELRAHNWSAFARGYNGPRYAETGHHIKLKQRYEWWSRKPDTPWSPDMEEPAEPELPPAIQAPERTGPLWNAYVALAEYFHDPEPSEKAPMIVKSVLAGVLADVVTDAVIRVARKAGTPLEPEVAPEVAAEVATETQSDPRLREVAAQVEHVTNNEPITQSRVSIGAIISGFAGIAGAFGIIISPEAQEQIIAVLTAIGTVAGAALTLYGRWKAKKPLFS